ncbi:MAG TPA: FixG Ig-like domain-containing protein, partial [bacterium]|nr:FixG Ig-like domain-containing protein [bacterium]
AKVLNKTFDAMQIEFKLEGVEGNIALIGTHELRLHPDELVESTFLVDIPRNSIHTMNTKIKIGVYKDGMKVSTEETSFVSPMQ